MTFLTKKLLDEREGFANITVEASEVEASEVEATEEEEPMEELSYTVPSDFEKQSEMSFDTKMISDLQEQMNELFRLSEKAVEINKHVISEN